ncbi:hypothetical protein SDC9_68486 [bioreactor metagenome]|uniref:Uncharacterized protein n=1 Tax=bioreactor metagenome TaxID=1076179 RepID=A0A644Y0K5_9ZZZZ
MLLQREWLVRTTGDAIHVQFLLAPILEMHRGVGHELARMRLVQLLGHTQANALRQLDHVRLRRERETAFQKIQVRLVAIALVQERQSHLHRQRVLQLFNIARRIDVGIARSHDRIRHRLDARVDVVDLVHHRAQRRHGLDIGMVGRAAAIGLERQAADQKRLPALEIAARLIAHRLADEGAIQASITRQKAARPRQSGHRQVHRLDAIASGETGVRALDGAAGGRIFRGTAGMAECNGERMQRLLGIQPAQLGGRSRSAEVRQHRVRLPARVEQIGRAQAANAHIGLVARNHGHQHLFERGAHLLTNGQCHWYHAASRMRIACVVVIFKPMSIRGIQVGRIGRRKLALVGNRRRCAVAELA